MEGTLRRGDALRNGDALDDAAIAALLTKTSRTFALAIPLLDARLARQVGVAYLLFRIADTLEDAPLWPRTTRAEALTSFVRWLDGAKDATWPRLVDESPPTRDAGCLELLSVADRVLEAAAGLEPSADHAALAEIVRHHTRRTAQGMLDYVERQDDEGGIVLRDLEDLKAYCYVVAGIVGELLTSLFVALEPSAANVRSKLEGLAASFGEGLQLVNILKDRASDVVEGRSYIPPSVPTRDVFDLARADLESAARYVHVLREAGVSQGTIAFCELPRRLAVATLAALEAGAPKLSREDVLRIVTESTRG